MTTQVDQNDTPSPPDGTTTGSSTADLDMPPSPELPILTNLTLLANVQRMSEESLFLDSPEASDLLEATLALSDNTLIDDDLFGSSLDDSPSVIAPQVVEENPRKRWRRRVRGHSLAIRSHKNKLAA